MRERVRTYAAEGIGRLEAALTQNPPAGVSLEYVTQFFEKYREVLVSELAKLIDAALDARVDEAAEAAVAKYDALRRTEPTPTWEGVASRVEQTFPWWLYPRELPLLVDEIAHEGIRLTMRSAQKLLHLDGNGILGALAMLYSAPETPAVLTIEQYLTYDLDDAGWRVSLKAEPNPDFGPGSHQATLNIPLRWESVPSLGAAVDRVNEFIEEHDVGGGNFGAQAGRVTYEGKPYARISYNRRIWKVGGDDWQETGEELGEDGQVIGPRQDLARLAPPPSPIQIELPPEEWSPAKRTASNLAAIRLLEEWEKTGRQLSPEDRRVLLDYSGFGGLSIERIEAELPEGYRPELRGLIHEYYTPSLVSREIARLLRPRILSLPTHEGTVLALEPSAGIGRLVNACSGPGFEALSFTAVEYSRISSQLLRALRPDITVFQGPFERWVAENEEAVRGKLGLLVSNPPYGQRGASLTEDPNKDYRERKAYAYFLRRGLDLLAPGGIGVFLIPYGFLTGQNAALRHLRERVLRRHHLLYAFRLPSKLFPGALLVTDLLFFQARGGELPAVLAEDEAILEGKYFEHFPSHILGVEQGRAKDEDDTTRKPRWGYQVEGTFSGLPDVPERAMCSSCAVTSFFTAPERPRRKASPKEALAPAVQAAISLGERVAHYAGLLAKGDKESTRTAAALHTELRDALLAWWAGRKSAAPEERAVLRQAERHPEMVALHSAFKDSGDLADAFAMPPVYVPSYQGGADDLGAQAEFLYRTRRHLTLDALREFRHQLGIADLGEPLETRLIAAGFCKDGTDWLPARDYYTGFLWPRYERAKVLAEAGDPQAANQAVLLLQAIRLSRLEEIAPEPRMPWVPETVIGQWLTAFTESEVPPLLRENGVLRVEASTFSTLKDVAGQRLSVALGYINHDASLFRPPASRATDPTTGEKESAEEALTRARLEYGTQARKNFAEFLAGQPDLIKQVEDAYNRLFRGYVTPEYGAEELHIARWTGRIVLKPHQRAGAQRLIAHQGGLLGFDVGVGKTFTGIATLSALRQAGRAKRPIILVPNTLTWQWWKSILRALPDYRVVVIGSERYIGRKGSYTSRIDTPEERAKKWRQFQAGDFDVALVTYSVFGRNRLRAETVKDWIYKTPPLLRTLVFKAREMLSGVKEAAGEEEDDSPRKRKITVSAAAVEKHVGSERYRAMTEEEREKAAEELVMQREAARQAEEDKLMQLIAGLDLAERERAVMSEAVERWVAERLEMNEEPDPGIYWEDLQCDLLILDEAQNMKNLWPVQAREGGIPKYLGAITEGSDRAWNFALRAAVVRERTGGSGVVLLSATPAKNSPLEYFTLLGYVDGEAWTRLGITDPEVFIDRYLRLEWRTIVGPDLKPVRKSVVAGFQNLEELRDVVFRYAEFRTAEEVGLKLPETQVVQLRVPMSEAQIAKYETYLDEYAKAIKRGAQDPKARLRALGLLQRMALVAIHPELDEGPGFVTRRRNASAAVSELSQGNPLVAAALGDALGMAGISLDSGKAVTSSRAPWTWQNARQVRDPSCPKLRKTVELILEKPECGHIFFCDNVAVHFWLRELLAQAGFPVERIAIFNADQAPNPARRQLLAEKFNGTPPILDEQGNVEQEGIPPEYDVVIANATAYEGIDLHVRTCNVYHGDLPWEPATLQQRNGRAVRQGNMQAVLRIFYLLSDRSMDAVRLGMILGKLGWMKDILKSADRETNNPAAQSEMGPEELLLFLARDPEQAKAAIEEQKRLLAEETRKRVQQQAWTSLRGLYSRALSLRRLTDDAERAQTEREMEELRGYLAQVPSETWPWFFLTDVAQAGEPLLFGPEWALYSPSFILGEGDGFEVGELRGSEIGVRLRGEFAWQKVSADKAAPARIRALLAELKPEHYRNLPPADIGGWDLAQDEEGARSGLRATLPLLRGGDFGALALDLASTRWRQWLWESYGAAILDALSTAPRSMSFRIPMRGSGPVRLLYGDELIGMAYTNVMPFTTAAFPAFIEAAPTSGYKWSELHATATAWWGRPFPKGILRDSETDLEVEIAAPDGKKKVRALWQGPYFAVTYKQERGPDHPEGPRYVVTHLKSGLAAGQNYPSVEHARIAAEYLATFDANWDSSDPEVSRLPVGSTLKWIAEQPTAPTLFEIQKRATA